MTGHPEVVFVTGSGRSGTSWLGELLRSGGDCVYKYEPFSPAKLAPYHQWAMDLPHADPGRHRDRFFEIARKGYWDVDRPPLNTPPRRPAGKLLTQLHRASGRYPALRPVFTAVARPDTTRPVLIKDVWFPNPWLGHLDRVLHPKVIAIVRHPYAAVGSTLRGRSLGVWNPAAGELRARIRQLAAQDLEADLRDLVDRVDALNEVELEALRWRLEAEPSTAFAESHGRLVVFERLVVRPELEIGKLFRWLGWPMTDATFAFVEQTRRADESRNVKDAFFSVNRTGQEALHGWRQYVTDAQVADIDRVVGGSRLRHHWPAT